MLKVRAPQQKKTSRLHGGRRSPYTLGPPRRDMTYKAMTPQCVRSVVQVLVVRVDIGVVNYEAMTPECGRSVVQVIVAIVVKGVVTYEAMTPQCGRPVVQVLVVRVDRSRDL